MNNFIKGDSYNIYIGLKDQDTYEELISTDDFLKLLVNECNNNKVGFSLCTQKGGYEHNKGYTIETSLKINLIGASFDEVERIAKNMKKYINTDTILITKEEVEYQFI